MENTAEIEVSSGRLVGRKTLSVYNKKEYLSFQGIPFAEPPVGNLRFKDPVPVKPWQGVKQCTKPGEICAQKHEFRGGFVGSEDCLFLNVYTPKIYSLDELKPVMVWVHGGGFTFGSGDDELYSPDFFVQKDVVLVTINYRVGVFGFLSLGNKDVPGNAGLKDQTLALKWVQENIHNFGGDAKNVTIFGESAGAASVQYLSLSPMSKGLFHRVIMQSGCVLNPWAFYENPVPRAYSLAELLGKKTNDIGELLSFLRNQKPEDLVKHQRMVLSRDERKKLSFPFVPCKEIPGTGTNFLVESPETLLKSGQFADVPYIIGVNDKEGLISLKEHTAMIEELDEIDKQTIRFVPHDLYERKDVCEHISSDAKEYYLGSSSLTKRNFSHYLDLLSDLEFTIGINKTLKYLARKELRNVYVYQFSFDGELGYCKQYIQAVQSYVSEGVCHADDLGYLFYNRFVNGNEFNIDPNSPEKKMIDTLITLWTNFAAKGDPNGENISVNWKANDSNEFKYLDIGKNLVMVNSKLMKERDDFWEKIYSSYPPAPKL